jgi:thioredoxin reductase (NADPH)
MYDVVIIGGGPAGLTAGIYASRSRLKTLLIEKGMPGGQILVCDLIENYPGFPSGISGFDLATRMHEQAEMLGLETRVAEVESLDLTGEVKTIKVDGEVIETKVVILALGAKPKTLGVPGEEEYYGKGVSYCATCDGPFFNDKHIVVIGGGDTAVQESVFLAKFGSKVTIVHRRDSFRAARILQERAFADPKIDVIWNKAVKSIEGDGFVEKLILRDTVTGEESHLDAQGVFILIGHKPDTEFLAGQIELDEFGYIITDERMQTSLQGVYAAGDARQKSLRQIVTATSDGAIAAVEADEYLEELTVVHRPVIEAPVPVV